MPELPEVQTIVNELNTCGVKGGTITLAEVYWPRTIAEPSPDNFRQQITGKKILSINRRGKYIIFHLSDGYYLLIHLRMTGHLHWVSSDSERTKHEHVILSFDKGKQLRFHDTRKFGRFHLTRDKERITNTLGVEPLDSDFSIKILLNILSKHHRMMKSLLLDQHVFAGLGNIYTDEILWKARLHPRQISSSLNLIQTRTLFKAIRSVLKRGLKNLGTTLGNSDSNYFSATGEKGRNQNELKVFQRNNAPCTRCHISIKRIVVAQRSTFICPQCQKLSP